VWPGQAVPEFALTSLMLLGLFFGTLDIGRAVFARAMLTNAVREAARTGSITPSDLTAMRAAAANRSPGLGLTSTSTVITATCYRWSGTAWAEIPTTGCSTATSRDRLVIQANYSLGMVATRLIGISTIAMSERAQVRIP
jgi:Flp pilus assembly protein TadG